MKVYILIFFILGVFLSFGTSVIANGYLTSLTVEHNAAEIQRPNQDSLLYVAFADDVARTARACEQR